MYKLISLDLDDTLWPCMPTIEAAEKKLYQWLQQHCPPITQHYSQDDLRDKRRRLMAEQTHLAHDLSAARREHFKILADELNLNHNWIADAFEVYFSARQQVTLYDDVEPVLQQLKPKFILVALTNGNADIQRAGVGHLFHAQISAADVQAAKPDPAMFKKMMADYQLSAADCIHVGDHPVHDIQGATNAGISSVWLNRQQQMWPASTDWPDYEISNLYDLLRLFKT